MRRLLVTGGAGFIGSNFVRYVLQKHPTYEVVVLDKLTYAGNLDNLQDVAEDPRYSFVRGDIGDGAIVEECISGCDAVVNFAAETHVDRSIDEPGGFIMTDVFGVYVLLEAARRHRVARFLQVSTDEVYGTVAKGSSTEIDRLEPNSPYSASKAGGEMMVRAYHVTYGVPTLVTRGSNNFGPYQYPEKLIPLFITNALEDKPLPVYGDGLNVRDWVYVLDHCSAVDYVLHHGEIGRVYNVGGGNEMTNLAITHLILELLGKPADLITYVKDRPGHDRRYSLDCSELKKLGWKPQFDFREALEKTVQWYGGNRWWWEKIKSGEYAAYYAKQYGNRGISALKN
ncbi:MAG: dTDP-glucose 4,6-dehydratase [Chloroflexi bacterium]|nr:dTDP-glucose 4,6-dehydratase [Chloroflexota bacterium]